MPKLHLKRTPKEEAHRARKRQRKREKRHLEDLVRAAHLDDDEAGPSSLNYDSIQAEIENARFREKMSMAFEDDERLDSLEAKLNNFAHLPMRWGGGPSKNVYEGDEFLRADPLTMDDDEYAEWVRVGMYRKTHAQEFEEAQRRKAEKAAANAKERAARKEGQRLEKILEAEREQRRRERDLRRQDRAREEYEARWKAILSSTTGSYGFQEIPWPLASTWRSPLSIDDLTSDAISSFLFPTTDLNKKDRKDKLRETYLRFHPDKFEGRLMPQVHDRDKEQVRLAVGQVVRILNDLMKQ